MSKEVAAQYQGTSSSIRPCDTAAYTISIAYLPREKGPTSSICLAKISRSRMGRAYDSTRPAHAIDVVAAKATGPFRRGSPNKNAPKQIPHTADKAASHKDKTDGQCK